MVLDLDRHYLHHHHFEHHNLYHHHHPLDGHHHDHQHLVPSSWVFARSGGTLMHLQSKTIMIIMIVIIIMIIIIITILSPPRGKWRNFDAPSK